MAVIVVVADADDGGMRANGVDEPVGVGRAAVMPNRVERTNAPPVAVTPCQSIAASAKSGSSETESTDREVEFTPDVAVANVAPLAGDEVVAIEVVDLEDDLAVDREVVAPASTDDPLR